MAIEYRYKDKCGTAIFRNGTGNEYEQSLYTGNCFLIMVYEYEENGKRMEELTSFFVDDKHMEKCLKSGIYTGYSKLINIKINIAKCRNWKKIVELLSEYVEGINIELYKDGEYNWKEYQPVISEMRMREIAEEAVSYISDNGLLLDFLDDRCIEFSEKEHDYFITDEGDYYNEDDYF